LSQYAVFIDLENAGCKVATLQHIIEKVKIRGDIFLGKVYGYTEHFADLNPVLLSNTFHVVPSIRYGGRQKNNLDIQLVIDALEVAYINPLIDCVCIVSGDSDYTPLVGKLKSMGKTVLGISRSECASEIFINACNEFIFLESVKKIARPAEKSTVASDNGRSSMSDLKHSIEEILAEQADAEGWLFASELKSTLLRLRPDFSEKSFGVNTFGRLLAQVEKTQGGIRLMDDNNNLKIRLAGEPNPTATALTRDGFVPLVAHVLNTIREDGFERVNPSVIKAALKENFANFDERTLGYKKFSDFLKRLEKEGVVQIEWLENNDILVRITAPGATANGAMGGASTPSAIAANAATLATGSAPAKATAMASGVGTATKAAAMVSGVGPAAKATAMTSGIGAPKPIGPAKAAIGTSGPAAMAVNPMTTEAEEIPPPPPPPPRRRGRPPLPGAKTNHRAQPAAANNMGANGGTISTGSGGGAGGLTNAAFSANSASANDNAGAVLANGTPASRAQDAAFVGGQPTPGGASQAAPLSASLPVAPMASTPQAPVAPAAPIAPDAPMARATPTVSVTPAAPTALEVPLHPTPLPRGRRGRRPAPPPEPQQQSRMKKPISLAGAIKKTAPSSDPTKKN